MKNKKQSSDRAGTAFTENQQAVDKAINERIKSERGSGKKKGNEDTADTGSRNNKSDVSRKKTGGGKQSSPGD